LIIFLISATGGIENTSLSSSSNAKNGSHEFPEFLLEKFRNFGTWEKTEFPEIRKSEFPELQSLDAEYSNT